MITVIMKQDQLHVATVLYEKKAKGLLYNTAKGLSLEDIWCVLHMNFFLTKQTGFIFLPALNILVFMVSHSKAQ